MTVIAILSVDFPAIFPRRHIKTEHFGFSLVRSHSFLLPPLSSELKLYCLVQ